MLSYIVNYGAVIIAALVPMIVGMVWYGPLFGKIWMQLQGIDPNDTQLQATMKAEAKKNYIISFIGNIITAYIAAIMLGTLGALTIGDALLFAFLTWLAFATFIQLQGVLWGKDKPKLWILNTSYTLITWMFMAIILVLWK